FTVIGALFSCGAAVVSVLFSRRPASVELQGQVDELSIVLEKVLKTQRKEKMTRVRSAALEDRDDSGNNPVCTAPPAEIGQLPAGYTPTKIALIQQARQKGFRV
ncbi:MAG: hypothetical protein KGJ61_10445, partial [Candidatus Omnitrophica bacterium]|nr:hypothetical protein [Candidatus Omnitrophota bacterium]